MYQLAHIPLAPFFHVILSFIALNPAFTMSKTIEPLTIEYGIVCVFHNTCSMWFPICNPTSILSTGISKSIIYNTKPMNKNTILPIAFVPRLIWLGVFSLAVLFILKPRAFVLIPVGPCIDSLTFSQSGFKLAFIAATRGENFATKTIFKSIFPVSFVYSTFRPDLLSSSMWFAVFELTFVGGCHTILNYKIRTGFR